MVNLNKVLLKKSFLIRVGIFMVVLFGILYYFFPVFQKTDRVKALGSGAAVLSILPSTLNPTNGSNGTFSVTINPNNEQVSGVELVITYDPSVMTVTGVTPGNFFSSNLVILPNPIDNTTGRIHYAIAFPLGTNLSSSQAGIVATFNYTAVGNGTKPITLITTGVPHTIVSNIDAVDVLNSVNNATITVGTAQPSATPTMTSVPPVTVKPTSTVMPSSTLTPTAIPTSTPKPTSTHTPTPTHTPIPTATPTNLPSSTPIPPTATDIPMPTDTLSPTPSPSPSPTASAQEPTPTMVVTPIIPTPTSVPVACAKKNKGDANCDGNVNRDDFEIWRQEYRNRCSMRNLNGCGQDVDKDGIAMDADFNGNKQVDFGEVFIWYRNEERGRRFWWW